MLYVSWLNEKVAEANLWLVFDSCFEMSGKQREAMPIMIQDNGHKLINLAKVIVEYKLNPSGFTIVVPGKSVPKFKLIWIIIRP